MLNIVWVNRSASHLALTFRQAERDVQIYLFRGTGLRARAQRGQINIPASISTETTEFNGQHVVQYKNIVEWGCWHTTLFIKKAG